MLNTINSVKTHQSFQFLIGELPRSAGEYYITGKIAYAAQQPWLFYGSVRDNILFGQSYDKKRYDKVAEVCALNRDFEQLTHGDSTLVSDNGASLSGGQKARINLARAIYRKADIYIMDDPLAAVDCHVERLIFKNCIRNYLHSTTRILVTNQLNLLRNADLIIVMKEVSRGILLHNSKVGVSVNPKRYTL